MAGMIRLSASGDDYWTAASWLFDWTVLCIAENVDDCNVAEQLKELVELNFGYLSVEDFDVEDRRNLLLVIASRIVPVAEVSLQLRGGFDRDEALLRIRELAEAASRVLKL